jgi:NADH dehydrogenase
MRRRVCGDKRRSADVFGAGRTAMMPVDAGRGMPQNGYVTEITIKSQGDGSREGRGRPRVVVVGAGFGGLRVAKTLRGAPVEVVLIDRNNYHTFQPLLYEVATAGLEPDDIAQPVRAIFPRAENIRFRMADVEAIDLDGRRVVTDAGDVSYDYLVVAAGSETNFFGVRSAAEHALVLKDLYQATAIRNRVIRSFEHATITDDESERDRLMTMVVIGGGPTGVELAGALAELKRHVLPRDYPELDLTRARVILVEALDTVLAAMPARLQRRAREQLVELGVEVRLGAAVQHVDEGGVTLQGGERIESANVIWVAGVRGEPLGEAIGAELGASRRVRVDGYLRVPGHSEAHVIGDLAHAEGADGRPYPMLAQVAMQQGETVAKNIVREMRGQAPKRFRYRDKGTMATVGRRKAVAHVFGLQLSGVIAWWMWLVVHLLGIIGLRNRALVLVNWTWNYFRYDRANRLVTDRPELTAVAGRRERERVEAGRR